MMVSVFVVICVVSLETNTKHNDGTGSHPWIISSRFSVFLYLYSPHFLNLFQLQCASLCCVLLSFTGMLFGSLSLFTLDYHVSQCALLIRVLYLFLIIFILFYFPFVSKVVLLISLCLLLLRNAQWDNNKNTRHSQAGCKTYKKRPLNSV